MSQQEFSIIPVLGRKTDVVQNDPTLFRDYGGLIATHDVGGLNYDLQRKRNACAKANGYALWSKTANAQATKCLGLFELYDGTNREHIMVDNGVIYVFTTRSPGAKSNVKVGFDSGSTEPTLGETVSENGGDASGTLVAYEVSSGTWAGGDAAGTLYLEDSSGTWTDNAQLDGATTGADFATEDGGVATSDTFATDNQDLYSMIKVGDYFVFADRGETTPHKWSNGDVNLSPLITSGTFYKFRYLVNFGRRVVGLYCPDDSNAPDLSVRWSTAWPSTTISNLTFPAANQLYIPNDDPIVGGLRMGMNRCFIYCEDSIQQLVYYEDYETPFRCFTVVPHVGASNYHSIVSLGDRHYFFNKDFGFMEFMGSGTPVAISDDIIEDIKNIDISYKDLIVGAFLPFQRAIVWTVPMQGSTTPNRLLFYHVDTKQWWFMDRSFRYVDYWQGYDSSYTWQDLIRDLGGLDKSRGTADTDTADKLVDSGATFETDGVVVGDEAHNITDGTFATVSAVDSETSLSLSSDVFPDGTDDYEVGEGAKWEDAGTKEWAFYTSYQKYLVYANTDGKVYTHSSEKITSSTLDGYRIEPILDFGDAKRKDLLQEIWFQFGYLSSNSIHVYHRSGDTVGETQGAAWTDLGTLAMNADKPVVILSQTARLHQIKWGTDSNSEYFEVNKITFKFIPQSEN